MSDESKTVVFKLLSFLLGYPDDTSFWQGVEESRGWAHSLPDTPAKHWLMQTLSQWADCDPTDLRREYVQNFDFRESTCLYLTAHEYGDSRERGSALIEIHRLFRVAGCEPATSELPDYLPGLFEFLSIKPIGLQTEGLAYRIAQVCHRILGNLGEASLYHDLFCAALASLPDAVYEGETLAFPKREKADRDPLPYPLNVP